MKQSSYLTKTLGRDEQILVRAQLHKLVYFPSVFFIFFGLVALIAGIELTRQMAIFVILEFVGVFMFLIGLIDVWRNKCREMVGTSKRVIDKRGIFSFQTAELRNDKIESVSVDQTVWGRIFGFGDVRFSGTGTTRIVFRTIANPVQTKIAFEEIIAQSESEN